MNVRVGSHLAQGWPDQFWTWGSIAEFALIFRLLDRTHGKKLTLRMNACPEMVTLRGVKIDQRRQYTGVGLDHDFDRGLDQNTTAARHLLASAFALRTKWALKENGGV